MNYQQFDEPKQKHGDYPNFLTKEEKAEIKSALLEKLKGGMRLRSYLQELAELSTFPEADPQTNQAPVVVTVQIMPSQNQ